MSKLEYMKYVTNNTNTFVAGEKNLVACVFCVEIYDTDKYHQYHSCLVCEKCGIDALMVVAHSPLLEMSDEDRMNKLNEWHKKGFTPIPMTGK